MYRILLVDDEHMELQALKNYIDWNALGIDRVDSAKNGKAAYELVLEKQPDIVITDIQMPVMDGLTLAKKIYELNRHIKIVFLTGYDEFAYVKEAMHVNAVDYLLKPFSEESIVEVIGRVKAEIERDNLFRSSVGMLEKRLLNRLCTETETDENLLLQELERTAGQSDRALTYGMIQFWGITNKNIAESMEKRLAEIETLWAQGRSLTFLVKGYADVKNAASRIQKILFELTENMYSCVYMEHSLAPEKLRGCYQLLKGWENELFYEEKAGICPVKEGDEPSRESAEGMGKTMRREVIGQLEEAISQGKENELEKVLHSLFSFYRERKTQREQVLHEMYAFVFKMEDKFCIAEEDAEERKSDFYGKMADCSSMTGMQDFVREHFLHMAASYGDNTGGKTSFVVKKVKEYVQKNYDRSVTVEDMAAEIHLSSNYIRSIFKEGTGQTILEYITNYRFQRACELLRDPILKIKEVSSMVGYDNVSYFCAVFTKRYGMSPNEYRNKFL